MSRLSSHFSMNNGVFTVNEQPKVLITAEYPYFRDIPSNWKDRLLKLKSIGIDIVTTYIPWRHHQPNQSTEPDFVGYTQANRNVLSFIDLCKELDILLIVKPGPFIHAETNYGGLPDWVCPLINPDIEPMLNNRLQPKCWLSGAQPNSKYPDKKWPLPAPLGENFIKLTTKWFEQVVQTVISQYLNPNGPIILAQIGNEGIYCDAQHALWDMDYSASALGEYKRFLLEKYQHISKYNLCHSVEVNDWHEIEPPYTWNEATETNERTMYQDWGEFQSDYFSRVLSRWRETLNISVPIVVNVNPPVNDPFGVASWLSRVEPERWENIHYGFTNWIGDVSSDSSAFNRYQITAKRAPGPNMEENWGFSEIYDPAYKDASTCFYQTLAVLNGGATGFNIYTGVGTSFDDKYLDSLSSNPYPDAAPITENGEITSKGRFIHWLTDFFDCCGKEFLESTSQKRIAWGFYPPNARVNAWISSKSNGVNNTNNLLESFQDHARMLNIDYGLFDLEAISQEDLINYPRVIVLESDFQQQNVQQNLIDYVKSGGLLALLGNGQNINLDNLDIDVNIKESISSLTLDTLPTYLQQIEHPTILEGHADIWIRSHPHKDVYFITVLFPKGETSKVKFSVSLNDNPFEIVVQAAPSGGAIFRMEEGRLSDCIIKGVNKYLNIAVSPLIKINDTLSGLNDPGDYSLISGTTKIVQDLLYK